MSSPLSAHPAGLNWPVIPAKQQPIWPDEDALAEVRDTLASLPPLVFAGEADDLRERLGKVAQGKAFLLQGGDCAEMFDSATADNIRDRIKTILQMAVVLTYGASMPVVKLGRIAGQFAKPRSADMETRNGEELPSYRGDMVNGFPFTTAARIPDPQRMVQAYNTSAATLNLVRAFTGGGFADMRYVNDWNRGFVSSNTNRRYGALAAEIDRAMKFMEAAGVSFAALRTVDFFSSHEALIMDYERPLVRIDSRTGKAYATSGHMVWIGERTREYDGAHIDFISRISNPVGIKVGPNADPEDLLRIVDKVDPERTPGRITFITRMGCNTIRENLPPIVEKLHREGVTPVWVTDPMHGNTFGTRNGYKTRSFDDVLDEVRGFFEVHQSIGTIAGGIHVELTGNDVTECIGGTEEINEKDLEQRYETACDPRLNHKQSLQMAFDVADMLAARNI